MSELRAAHTNVICHRMYVLFRVWCWSVIVSPQCVECCCESVFRQASHLLHDRAARPRPSGCCCWWLHGWCGTHTARLCAADHSAHSLRRSTWTHVGGCLSTSDRTAGCGELPAAASSRAAAAAASTVHPSTSTAASNVSRSSNRVRAAAVAAVHGGTGAVRGSVPAAPTTTTTAAATRLTALPCHAWSQRHQHSQRSRLILDDAALTDHCRYDVGAHLSVHLTKQVIGWCYIERPMLTPHWWMLAYCSED